jgi:steroid delta-isomerase-like uncharacterized protein
MIPPTNTQLVQRFWDEIWNRGDLTHIDEIVAPGFNLIVSIGTLQGPEGLKRWFTGLHAAFPDLQFTLDEVISEGNAVVTRWTAHGTHTGPFNNVPPTGRQITLTGVSIFKIDDTTQRIIEDRSIEDSLGLMQQLGMQIVPGPTNVTP